MKAGYATAVHEAGHTTIAIVNGVGIRGASIARNDTTNGRVTFQDIGDVEPWRLGCVYLAGGLAEEKLAAGHPHEIAAISHGARVDRELLATLLRACRTEGDPPDDALIDEWTTITKAQVHLHWPVIETIAKALLASPHGRLRAADIHRIWESEVVKERHK
jgi:hypothetical protein